MKHQVIVFLAMCAVAAAMVPRERRAVNMEEELGRRHAQESSSTSTGVAQPEATTAEAPKICEPETICAWSTYRSVAKFVEGTIENKYCTCGKDKTCAIVEDDTTANAYVHRCRPRASEDLTTEESSQQS